eukprot:TRINITY_DN8225_c0_g1_i5.p1 TRINITY_DN8225_c0_g1~~TRINITY_DN8225_c0_g1_i5.p1  ORF type:complete len:182 (-),score=41.83 TRINITY_DN8225_c0_g1_i5:63-608(-)
MLTTEEVHSKQQVLMEAIPHLRWDLRGAEPDAFTKILDELVLRAAAPPPEAIECFDPRERYGTERCVSNATSVNREEQEIYGTIACCPRSSRHVAAEGVNSDGSSRRHCNLNARGRCMRFVEDAKVATGDDSGAAVHEGPPITNAADDAAARRANLRAHLQAVFVQGTRFDERLPEDQVCG